MSVSVFLLCKGRRPTAFATLLVLLVSAATISLAASETPLHAAAIKGDAAWIDRLLKSGKYDVNAKDGKGRTPLAVAMATCRDGTVSKAPNSCPTALKDTVAALLICAGANVNVDVFPGYKLVHAASCHGSSSLYYLLAAKADPNALYRDPNSKQLHTPLTWALTCKQRNAAKAGAMGYADSSIVPLIDAGANPIARGPAQPAGALLTVPTNLRACSKPKACTPAEVTKRTDVAVAQGQLDASLWKYLWAAQEGMYVDSRGGLKRRVAASGEGTPDWVKKGRAYVCQTAQTSLTQETAAAAAKERLDSYQARYPLHYAAAGNNLEAVKKLLASGKLSVDGKDDRGLTPLQAGMDCSPVVATGKSCWPRITTPTAELLVSKGAKVKLDVYPKARPGYTLLHDAASHGLTSLVQVLLQAGADPNAVWVDPATKTATTPLMSAATCDPLRSTGEGPGFRESTSSTVKALLAAGARPLPFGPSKPLTLAFGYNSNEWVKKCSSRVGACSPAVAEELVGKWPLPKGTCREAWYLMWRAQEQAVAGARSSARFSAARVIP